MGALINTIGLNKSTSQFICKKFGFQKKSSLRHLDNLELEQLNFFLSTNFRLNDSLTDQTKNNIKTKIDLSTHGGKRHNLGYPVRGQRTLSNGKTQKRLSKFRFYYASELLTHTFFKNQRKSKNSKKLAKLKKQKEEKLKKQEQQKVFREKIVFNNSIRKNIQNKEKKREDHASYLQKLDKIKSERQKQVQHKFIKAHKEAQKNHPYFLNIQKAQ